MRRCVQSIVTRSAARRLGLVLLVTLVATTGCFHRGRRVAEDTITIHVINQNLLDMVIYSVNSGARFRIGTATGLSDASWDVKLSQLNGTGDVQLLADPIGSSDGVRSDVVHVYDGQIVEWTLGAKLGMSLITVR